MSASLWGCELKWRLCKSNRTALRQPPCEAVSWNMEKIRGYTADRSQPPCEAVSWNINQSRLISWKFGQPPCEAVSWNLRGVFDILPEDVSASLWGCELKFVIVHCYKFHNMSASLWGCELKCLCRLILVAPLLVSLLVRLWVEILKIFIPRLSVRRQPPCEAVSWNSVDTQQVWRSTASASLWGCELKWADQYSAEWYHSQPPCEAVSWNTSKLVLLLST